MKHNVARIDSYSNVKGREQIDWTLHNHVSYSIENILGVIRGFIKVDDLWEKLNDVEAKNQYEFILHVIESEMKKEC